MSKLSTGTTNTPTDTTNASVRYNYVPLVRFKFLMKMELHN